MRKLNHVEILGGGPAGLYTAILLRRRMPEVSIRVSEQNPAGATFGFGVVFSDQALDFLNADDPEPHELLAPRMERWRNMTLNHPDGRVELDGVGFSAIGRLDLIEILRGRAEALGIDMRFGHAVGDVAELEADLSGGADGLNSLVRTSEPEAFGTTMDAFSNHFAWFGTKRPFDTLTQTFVETSKGALNAHHYRYAPDMSTFIVECGPETFANYGFADMDEAASARACGEIFADVLDGAELITNRSMWRTFPKLWCNRWHAGNRVLMGDAVHTAHFSIGSGTRLAMEDAIALVNALATEPDIDAALSAYDARRRPIAEKLVKAANTSATWYDSFEGKMALKPLDFAYDYLMRSGRMDDDRLRRMAPEFMGRYDAARLKGEAGITALADTVPDDAPGAVEIGFDRAAHHNCSQILWDNLARNPDKPALVGPAGTQTYADLIAGAARWGNAFTAFGLERGARIPMFLDDTPAYPAAFFGAVRAGFVPVLLNTQTPPDTLRYFLQDTDARIALCEASLLERFGPETTEGTGLTRIVVVNGAADGPLQITADEMLAGQPTDLPCAETGPDDMAFWMYSSGTTGRPKGIVHLHHDMAYSDQSFGREVLKLAPDDICFSVPKMFFAYGFGNSITFPFAVGATTLLMPGQPRPDAVLDCIEAYKPTVFFGLPTLFTALCKSDGIAARDLSSLRQSMSAAEVLSEEVYAAWKNLTGHGPTEGLGSTEMLHVYLSNALDDHRPGAAGARVPGYEVKLVLPDGTDAPDGEDGVMMVRGHSQAPCYWNRPDKTAETMRNGWIWTGDRFIRKDGYYYFQGRADELIKVSGQWVWPLEVERCLNEHPDVLECAVMAHELADRRMTLRAVVRLNGEICGSDAVTERLQAHVKAVLQPFKYPRIVDYVAEIPKTGTGKIDRAALKGR